METHSRYGMGFREVFYQFDGKILAAEGRPTVVEGDWPIQRTIVMTFPSPRPRMPGIIRRVLNPSQGSLAVLDRLARDAACP